MIFNEIMPTHQVRYECLEMPVHQVRQEVGQAESNQFLLYGASFTRSLPRLSFSFAGGCRVGVIRGAASFF